MQTTVNNFLNELNSHPRWTTFKSDIQKKFNSELAKIKETIGQDNWILAEKNYQDVLKKLTLAQKQLDQEFKRTLKSIKKSASSVEKTIAQYKAIALKQKAEVKKKATAQKMGTKKSASPKRKSTKNRKKATKV
ncbi:MAG: hypothetical protein RJB66_814 [Pseudomonadota bacterium]|jgi:hypothetical protein